MTQQAVTMVEVWRGGLLESYHAGHAVICDEKGNVVEAWGNPDAIAFPRSSCKMVQALPLLETGAAAARVEQAEDADLHARLLVERRRGFHHLDRDRGRAVAGGAAHDLAKGALAEHVLDGVAGGGRGDGWVGAVFFPFFELLWGDTVTPQSLPTEGPVPAMAPPSRQRFSPSLAWAPPPAQYSCGACTVRSRGERRP